MLQANMAVVNEHYPAECIQYRTLVNPGQILYHVRGCPPKVVAEQKDRIADPAVDSLPLKTESRANADPSPTSSSTDTSEQLSAPCHTAVDAVDCTPSSVAHAPNSHLRNGPADALDEVIEELLAVKDLVSRCAERKHVCNTDRESLWMMRTSVLQVLAWP